MKSKELLTVPTRQRQQPSRYFHMLRDSDRTTKMADDAAVNLPAGWTRRRSTKREMYYYVNTHTNETCWEVPTKPASPAKKRKAEDAEKKEQVQCLHILRKHSGSRRPSSWREEEITQSKEDAIRQITEFRTQLLQRQDDMETLFRSIASKESDCSSAKSGGDLGMFGRGAMQKTFEAASFALNVGELSDLVDSDSGIHIIFRVK